MLDDSMNIFDILLIQPIFNVLIVIYGLIPGHDFGLAIILFTILVRLAMWPLVKKQLRQTKIMRSLHPELLKIKKKAKGNKQQEAAMMMELYRERGINPFSSIGLLLVQLPIFITLFVVVRLMTEDVANIGRYTYGIFEQLPAIQTAISGQFDSTLLGLIDLSNHAVAPETPLYWPLLVMAAAAAMLQFFQSRQLLPAPKQKRRLRDMLKEQAAGKQIDQAEMSALMGSKMVWLFPILTFIVSVYLSGALVLYLLAQSTVAIIQQHFALKQDEQDLKKISEKTKTKVQNAKTADVVGQKKGTSKKKRGS